MTCEHSLDTRWPSATAYSAGIDGVVPEAQLDGFPVPSAAALTDARRLLPALQAIAPLEFDVYGTPDGEVAIDAQLNDGRSVIVLLAAEGGALCLVDLRTTFRRARYSSRESLPDPYLAEALRELTETGSSANRPRSAPGASL